MTSDCLIADKLEKKNEVEILTTWRGFLPFLTVFSFKFPFSRMNFNLLCSYLSKLGWNVQGMVVEINRAADQVSGIVN